MLAIPTAVHAQVPLTLVPDSISFSEDADVLVWTRPEGTALSRDELSRDDATASALTADGTIEDRFERTAYSGNAVYVVVRTTNAEGEPVLYESVWETDDEEGSEESEQTESANSSESEPGPGFGPVTDGTITMVPVPEQHQATMAELFPAPGSNEWFTWTFYGLMGGLLLVVVLIVGRGLTKKKQRKNRRRREKSIHERFWGARSPSASEPEPNKETSGQELVEAGADAREKGAVSSRTSESGGTPQTTESPDDGVPGSAKAEAKINAQQKEINVLRAEVDAKYETIASLKKKLQRKDQKLERKSQKLYDRIQTIQNLKEKRNPEEETESALKQQVEELNAENEELSEEVDRLSATVAEKNEALQSAQSEESPAYEEVPARDDEETAKYIEELEDENEWLEQTMKALRRRLPDAPIEDEDEEHETALAQQVAKLRTKNEQLEATVSDLESKLTETTGALEAAQAEAKATDAASSNHDATNEQVAELEETRDHLERRLRKDRQTLKNAQETVEQLRSEKQDLEAKAQQLRQAEAENEELKTQIESLRAKIEDLKADRAAAPADEGPSEPDEAEVDAAYAEIQQKLGDAFQSWCQQGRVMVGRYYMFERAVQDTYPDATVSPIYYTPEAAISFQFEDRRAVATFWLVEIRGTSFLLPVPRRDGTFEALEPAAPAHSDATPAELAHAIPARVVASDNGYEIDEAGQLNFETSSSS